MSEKVFQGSGARGARRSLAALLVSVAVSGLLAVPAEAQDAGQSGDSAAGAVSGGNADVPAQGADIVVTGIRASLDSALNIKRNSNQIVDSIAAEDIGKFPDSNVAESLQRITGIQVSRTKSEGSGVAIRGLSDVRVELNGRSYYASIADIPAELVAGLDVYKSFSAEQPEGGLGGVINIRTRRPFDFKGFKLATSVGANYFENTDDKSVNNVHPRMSALISDRWDTGLGEFGALLNVAYQKVDFTRAGNTVQPYAAYDNIDGQPAIAPVGLMDNPFDGWKSRFGVQGALQWAPSANLELYVEGSYTRYRDRQDSRAIVVGSQNVNSRLTPAADGSFAFYEGTSDLVSGDFQNVPVESFSYIGDHDTKSYQVAAGGKYEGERFSAELDASYSWRSSGGYNWQVSTLGTIPAFHLDLDGLPSGQISGADLSNPALFKFNYFYKLGNPPRKDKEKAVRFDAHYRVSDTGLLRKINFGGRYTSSSYDETGWYTFYSGPLKGVSLDQIDSSLYSIANSPTFGSFVSVNPSLIRDSERLCTILQIGNCEPTASPGRAKGTDQRFIAGYVTADLGLDIGSVEVGATAGLRAVNTKQEVYAFETAADGTFNKITLGGKNTKYLPTFNIHANLGSNLVVRAAASKSLSRVGFGTLNPIVTVNPNYGTGTAGNPAIKPFTAVNYDVSVERYIGKGGIIYLAGFYKDVKGFLQNVTQPETIDGVVYQITRPQNGPKGTVKGFEAGVTKFFDFLPAPFDGLGVQANYTYVDSSAPGPVSGESVPLTGLSKNSYNLVGLFEKGIVSARVAYNWRDTYVVTTAAAGAGSAPIFAKPYGQLDASLTFNFTEQTSLTIDAVNINGTTMPTYYGEEHRPYEIYSQDRRIGITFRNSF